MWFLLHKIRKYIKEKLLHLQVYPARQNTGGPRERHPPKRGWGLPTQQCPDNSGGPMWTWGESNSRLGNANAA